jgi:hypothetical protein
MLSWFSMIGPCRFRARTLRKYLNADLNTEVVGFLRPSTRHDFIFDPLRSEPRYKELMHRIGLDSP